jgi:predicted DCC family thiol-disulfide oxidoreductase YuxK
MSTTTILIFDGDCGFCTTSARWIESRWPADRAAARASQSLSDAELAQWNLTRDDVSSQVWWVSDTQRLGANRAVSAALRTGRGPWPVVGTLMDLAPVALLARPAYFFVARHRHLLPGASESCRIS